MGHPEGTICLQPRPPADADTDTEKAIRRMLLHGLSPEPFDSPPPLAIVHRDRVEPWTFAAGISALRRTTWADVSSLEDEPVGGSWADVPDEEFEAIAASRAVVLSWKGQVQATGRDVVIRALSTAGGRPREVFRWEMLDMSRRQFRLKTNLERNEWRTPPTVYFSSPEFPLLTSTDVGGLGAPVDERLNDYRTMNGTGNTAFEMWALGVVAEHAKIGKLIQLPDVGD